jgi:hypothetical protein
MPSPLSEKFGENNPKKDWQWGSEQDTAFETLKTHLFSSPILGYAYSTLTYKYGS